MGWNWYGWMFLITLLLAGLFMISDLIKQKNEQAGAFIEQISAYGGYVGLGLIVFSVFNLISFLRMMNIFMAVLPVTGIILLAALIVGICVGLLESLPLLSSWGLDFVDPIGEKLMVVKIPLAFAAIGVSIYLMLWGIIQWGF